MPTPSKPVDPNKIVAALKLLGLEKAWAQLMALQPQNREQAKDYLRAFKEKALRPTYQQLALQHHPDRGGSEEKMKELSEAYNLLKDLTIFSRPRPRGAPIQGQGRRTAGRVVIIHVNLRGTKVTTSTSNSASSSTSYVRVDLDTGTGTGTGGS